MTQQMMKPFTEHPYKQGVTYVEHWRFAMGIAYRLVASAVAFVLHGMLPFMTIKPHIDLEATAAFLAERNRYIETAAATAHGYPALAAFEHNPDVQRPTATNVRFAGVKRTLRFSL